MITVMRVLVVGCMLLFSLRQFLPDIVPRIDVLSLVWLSFLIAVVWAAAASAYRRIKEVRSRAQQNT